MQWLGVVRIKPLSEPMLTLIHGVIKPQWGEFTTILSELWQTMFMSNYTRDNFVSFQNNIVYTFQNNFDYTHLKHHWLW